MCPALIHWFKDHRFTIILAIKVAVRDLDELVVRNTIG